MRLVPAKLVLLILSINLIQAIVLTAETETPSIFYRQHIQGQCAVIEDDSEDDLQGCEFDDEDDEEEDESFLGENEKHEPHDYGVMTLSYHSPRGIGYNRSYFSLGFSHVIQAKKTSFFSVADWRFHVLSSGRFAMNLGAGSRYINCSQTQALGVFAYYDFRTTHLKNYHQAGISLEWLTTCFDVRLNVYCPFGDPKSHTWHYIQDKTDPFSRVKNIYNYSYSRLELEIGNSFDVTDIIDFYIGAQSYYLKAREKVGSKQEAFGARLRLLTTAQDRPTLELIGSYDPIFKTRMQFTCSIPLSYRSSLANNCINKCSPKLFRKIGSLPVRDDIIVLKNKHYWNHR